MNYQKWIDLQGISLKTRNYFLSRIKELPNFDEQNVVEKLSQITSSNSTFNRYLKSYKNYVKFLIYSGENENKYNWLKNIHQRKENNKQRLTFALNETQKNSLINYDNFVI